MEEPTLTDRVEILEETVRELAALPKRVEAVESQVLQLRQDMRSEFSAMRNEVRSEFAAIRREIRDGDEETRRYMRILHEEVLTRISTIAKSRNTP